MPLVAWLRGLAGRRSPARQAGPGCDELTGLPNRAGLAEHLERAIARARAEKVRFALLFVELDGFKEVNTRFGRAAGDALLAAVGRRLRSRLRYGDCVARFDADEFVLLIEGVPGEHAAFAVVQRIVKALGQPYEIDGREIRAGDSVGLALGDGTGDAAAVLEEASRMHRSREELGATA